MNCTFRFALAQLVFVLVFAICAFRAQAQVADVLRDINQVPFDLQPELIHDTGTLTYFHGLHPDYSWELWRSDGTSDGTFLVQDLEPELNERDEPLSSMVHGLATVSGRTYFCATTEKGERTELYVTQGNRDDVVAVTDGRRELAGNIFNCSGLVTKSGKILFTTQFELVEFDPKDGSLVSYDLRNDTGGDETMKPKVIGEVDDGMYLLSLEGRKNGRALGDEPWLFNTLSGKATLLGDLNEGSGSSAPRSIVRGPGNGLFFLANVDSTWDRQNIYRVDTFGTLTPLWNGVVEEATELVSDQHRVYFYGRDPKTEMFRIYSWAAGEVEAAPIPNLELRFPPRLFAVVEGVLVFGSQRNNGIELFRATKEGVQEFDIWPGLPDSFPVYVGKIGKTVYFAATTEHEGRELWRYDPTSSANEPELVEDFNPGSRHFLAFVDVNDKLNGQGKNRLFVHGVKDGRNGIYMYQPGGAISFFGDISLPFGTGAGNVFALFEPSPAEFLFSANDPENGWALWISNGKPSGTRVFRPGVSGSDFTPVPGTPLVVFTGKDDTYGDELWVTDGTPQGTRLLRDLMPGRESALPTDFVVSGSLVYFKALDRLWRTDGTTNGTFALNDAFPSSSEGMAPIRGGVLFVNDDFAKERFDELWFTDGTHEGTRRVRRINADGYDDVENLFEFDGYAVFSANDAEHGQELWRTDGTAEGTWLVDDIVPGELSSSPGEFVHFQGKVYFVAATYSRDDFDWRIFSYDGAAVIEVFDPLPQRNVLNPVDLRVMQGSLFYFGEISGGDWALFRSDGTHQGTEFVVDVEWEGIYPLTGARDIGAITYFAMDGSLWETDGSAEGTKRVLMRFPNTGVSRGEFAELNGNLYFSANDPILGDELFVLPLNPDALWEEPDSPGGECGSAACNCDISPGDADGSGIPDCRVMEEFRFSITELFDAVQALRPVKEGQPKKKKRTANERKRVAKAILEQFLARIQTQGAQIVLANPNADLQRLVNKLRKAVKKALRLKNANFKKNKRRAKAAIRKLEAAFVPR